MKKNSLKSTFEVEYVDFSNGRRLKTAMVLNPSNTPVVVNEIGQTLGGMRTGKVILSDSVVIGAIKKGFLLVLSST